MSERLVFTLEPADLLAGQAEFLGYGVLGDVLLARFLDRLAQVMARAFDELAGVFLCLLVRLACGYDIAHVSRARNARAVVLGVLGQECIDLGRLSFTPRREPGDRPCGHFGPPRLIGRVLRPAALGLERDADVEQRAALVKEAVERRPANGVLEDFEGHAGSLLGVGEQQAADVLARVAGLCDEIDLPDTCVTRGTEGRPQVVVRLVKPLLSRLVSSYGRLDVRHRLLLVHGVMVAHARVATTMIPP